MNNKVQGSKDIALIECINPRLNKYRVRWDLRVYVDEDGGEGACFYENEFNHKPTIEEIKSVILAQINSATADKIISGFIWNNMSVWLSNENQFNYKAAYDFAVQTNGANLPVTFKFGSTEQPYYYTFETIEDIQDFYISAMSYINKQLRDGWKEKDSYDWEVYNRLLAD